MVLPFQSSRQFAVVHIEHAQAPVKVSRLLENQSIRRAAGSDQLNDFDQRQ
jgi:hypothetical protein